MPSQIVVFFVTIVLASMAVYYRLVNRHGRAFVLALTALALCGVLYASGCYIERPPYYHTYYYGYHHYDHDDHDRGRHHHE